MLKQMLMPLYKLKQTNPDKPIIITSIKTPYKSTYKTSTKKTST